MPLNPFDQPTKSFLHSPRIRAHSVIAIEYINCNSADRYDFPNVCPGYNTKQSDWEALIVLELWEMWSTPLLPSLPAPLWPGEVALDRVLSMGQIELFDI